MNLRASTTRTGCGPGANVIEPDYSLALIRCRVAARTPPLCANSTWLQGSSSPTGSRCPRPKTQIDWEDQDTVLVGTDFGDDSLTESGYPRLVKRWRRGQPLAEAELVFSAAPTDVLVAASVDRTPGFGRTMLRRAIDFFNDERLRIARR